MAATLEPNKPLDEACRLAGRFLHHYPIMEQALDLAIGKLLGLPGGTTDIISANIPVAKKVDVLFSAEKFRAAIPEEGRQKFLGDTKSGIMTLNNDRVIMAHCPFEPSADGGVTFRRVVSPGELRITSPTYLLEEIESKCTLAVELAAALDRVAAEMKPYEPSLDFTDVRNTVYIAALGA